MSDLKLVNGDLVIDNNKKDLDVHILKEDAVLDNLYRRILSTKEQYLVYYNDQTLNSSVLRDTDYGTNLHLLSSLPISIAQDRLNNEVLASLRRENRITITSINVELTNPYTINVQLRYYYNGREYSIEV